MIYEFPHSQTLKEVLENFFTFSIVRHPFDRLVSAYQDKVEPGGYVKHLLRKNYQNHDFETFLTHVIKTVTLSDQKKPDKHWRPFEARCAVCQMNYDVIGRSETYAEDTK